MDKAWSLEMTVKLILDWSCIHLEKEIYLYLLNYLPLCLIFKRIINDLKKWFVSSTASEFKALQKEEEKLMARINAAHRSFITNIALIIILILTSAFFSLVSKQTGTFYSALISSIFKTVFPILTSLANFGAIQSVTLKYWANFKQRFCHNETHWESVPVQPSLNLRGLLNPYMKRLYTL